MINWPEDLISDIARRKCVIFLGAGVSLNSTDPTGRRPKSWHQLLATGAEKTPSAQRRVINKLLRSGDYLTACEILQRSLGPQDYEALLEEEFLQPQFQAAEIHRNIFKLDSKIVATPNIDKIYETEANHLANASIRIKSYYDNDVAQAIRRNTRVVLKVHGTIDTPSRMIFTRREYAKARSDYSAFFSILDALVLTNTFLFIGCGVNDPDIRLILENYTFRHNNVNQHYITFPKREISDTEIESIQLCTSLKFLTYNSKNHHEELHLSIKSLIDSVESCREKIAQSMTW